jgi:hypothetical protein
MRRTVNMTTEQPDNFSVWCLALAWHGIYVRAYAAEHLDPVAGMVLVDSRRCCPGEDSVTGR